MRKDNEMPGIDRRNLLKSLGLGAAGAAATTLSGQAEAAETPQEQVKPRYRENDHVKRFYALNRL